MTAGRRHTCGWRSRRARTASLRCSIAWWASRPPSRESSRSSGLTSVNTALRVLSGHAEFPVRAEQKAMSELDNHAIPVATSESWRAWLMTGTRRNRVDRRRMRGDHKGLKKILLEGLAGGSESPHAWKDFSGAMVRHAVDDAMRALPPEDKQVVKLA